MRSSKRAGGESESSQPLAFVLGEPASQGGLRAACRRPSYRVAAPPSLSRWRIWANWDGWGQRPVTPAPSSPGEESASLTVWDQVGNSGRHYLQEACMKERPFPRRTVRTARAGAPGPGYRWVTGQQRRFQRAPGQGGVKAPIYRLVRLQGGTLLTPHTGNTCKGPTGEQENYRRRLRCAGRHWPISDTASGFGPRKLPTPWLKLPWDMFSGKSKKSDFTLLIWWRARNIYI